METWLDIEGRMRALSEPLRFTRLDVHWGGLTGEGWRLATLGRSHVDVQFEQLCVIAGDALLRAFDGAPESPEWLAEPNDAVRWFRALMQLSGAFRPSHTFSEVDENGNRIASYTGSIDSVVEVSANLCLKLHSQVPLTQRKQKMALSPAEQHLALIVETLARLENPERTSIASDADIAQEAGLQTQDVQDYLDILEQRGQVKVFRHFGGSGARLTSGGRIMLRDPDFKMQNHATVNIDLSRSQNVIVNAGSTLNSVNQTINSSPHIPQHDKEELKAIIDRLHEALQDVPAEYADDVEAIADAAKSAVDNINTDRPNRSKLNVSVAGLKMAAENIAQIAPKVLSIAMELASSISSQPPPSP